MLFSLKSVWIFTRFSPNKDTHNLVITHYFAFKEIHFLESTLVDFRFRGSIVTQFSDLTEYNLKPSHTINAFGIKAVSFVPYWWWCLFKICVWNIMYINIFLKVCLWNVDISPENIWTVVKVIYFRSRTV